MVDIKKTKKQLIEELEELRRKVVDLSQQNKSEETHSSRDEHFRRAEEISQVGSFVVDISSGEMKWSDQVYCILGLEPGEINTDNEAFWAFVHSEDRDRLAQESGKVFANEADLDIQYRIVRKDGELRHVHTHANREMDEEGNLAYIWGFSQDITERKLLEERIHFLGQVTEQVTDAIITTDLSNNITYVNQAFQELYGYSREELIGQSPDILNASSDAPEMQMEIYRTVSNGETWRGEALNRRKDGSVFPCELTIYPVRGDTNQIIAYAGRQRDITERKSAEGAMKESEERFRKLFQLAPLSYQSLDENGNFLEVNETWCRTLGYSRDEVIGRNFAEFIDPSFRDVFECCFPQFKDAGSIDGVEHTMVKKDGSTIIASFVGQVGYNEDGSFKQTHCIFADVTERKRAEQALLDSEEKHRKLFERSNDPIFVHSLNGEILDVNNSACEMLGYSREQLLSMNVSSLHPEEEMERCAEAMIATEQHGSTVFESLFKTADGSILNVSISSKVVDPKHGIVQGIVRDVTESKRAEEKLHLLLDNLPCVAMIIKKGTREIVASNKAAHEMGAIPGATCYGACANRSEACTFCEAPAVWETGETHDIEVEHEGVWYRGIWVPLTDDLYVHYVFDITETKRLQALESRAERLEMAGTIAGQVAHDFNNLLAPLMAYPEFIREGLPENHPTLGFLDQIEKASHKIADINQDLLAMGRRGHYTQEVLDLNTVVQSALSELRPYPKNLVCDTEFADDLMAVYGGDAQLHRMISNLLHNARDAMQDVGQLTIKTENYYVDDVSVIYGRVPKGEYVKLTISDTGCGIPDNIIQKIFDPFFTSKSTDKKRGSGLGMSVVDAVLKDHNGFIDLSTKVGVGTSFYVYLPITRKAMDSGELAKSPGGSEGILIVDDDEIQREVTSNILGRLGYDVSVSESGEKAIEYLRENSKDLVILDMVMPGGIDGAETYRQILELHPNQKAIILSGYSETDRVIEAQRLGVGAFVRKPISKQVIASAIRTELERKRSLVVPTEVGDSD